MPAVPAYAIDEIDYPESDGQPVAETQAHFDELVDEVKQLESYFRDDPDVWVAGDLFVYFKKGEPKAVAAPDVLVVRGVEKKQRRKYLLWEEGVPPCFVVELTSKSTKQEDTGSKKQKYAQMGVEELFLFDVLGEYLEPRFQGFRLMGGSYRPMRPLPDGSLHSRTLGLTLKPEGQNLRLVETSTGKPLLRLAEVDEARRAAEQRAQEVERQVADAESRGLATGILALLAGRGVEVPEPVRSRILECSDFERLQKWLIRAATAETAEQVVEP